MNTLFAFVATTALTFGAAVTPDHTWVEPLWIDPAIAEGEGSAPACRPLGLVNFPPTWVYGDAAAVRLSIHGAQADPLAERLTTALLESGAAVVELTAGGDCSGPFASVPRQPRANLFGALRALYENYGPGLVLAIGVGQAGAVALEGVESEVAAKHLGAGGPRFAAALALRDLAPAIRLGTPPDAEGQRWPMRALLLCTLIDQLLVAEGRSTSVRLPSKTDCLTALLPPVEAEVTADMSPNPAAARGQTRLAIRPSE